MIELKKVLVFGSFDVLHKGHEYFFKKARELGDGLIVVIARDDTILKVKGRMPLHGEKERLRHVHELGIANKVMLGYKGDKFKIIERVKPSVIALGYDQVSFDSDLKKELFDRGLGGIKIVRLRGFKPEKYKSSLLKREN